MRRFSTAVAFLTRFPVPGPVHDARDVGKADLFFPVVGALIGTVQVLVAGLLGWLGAPPGVQALLSIVALILLVGGLHQDALADMVDGFGGGRSREDTLRIMRDSRVGGFGAIALMLALGTRAVAVWYLVQDNEGWRWVVVAAAFSRCSPWLGWLLPYARREHAGLGSALTDHVGPVEVMGGTGFALFLTIVLVGAPTAMLVVVGAAAVFIHSGLLCCRRIGGVTGDTLGAASETADVLLLVIGAMVVTG